MSIEQGMGMPVDAREKARQEAIEMRKKLEPVILGASPQALEQAIRMMATNSVIMLSQALEEANKDKRPGTKENPVIAS